jgi:hypothetical protein
MGATPQSARYIAPLFSSFATTAARPRPQLLEKPLQLRWWKPRIDASLPDGHEEPLQVFLWNVARKIGEADPGHHRGRSNAAATVPPVNSAARGEFAVVDHLQATNGL